MMKRGVTVAAVIWCSFGCGAAEDRADDHSANGAAGANSQAEDTPNATSQASVERRICDGSAGIRLAMGYGGGGPPFPYTSVLSELGYDFLYVDGSCHYWAHQPLSVADEYYLWRPYREGVLTPADEQRLHDAVSYDGAPAVACVPRAAVFDAGAAFLWDGRGLRSCADDVFDATGPFRAELFGAGTAVTGPMRIQVGQDSYPEPPVVYDWPLAAPIGHFVIEYGQTLSFRIDDATGATALRSLRDQAIEASEASSRYFIGTIAVRSSDGNESYFMSLRDELPFASADGLWVPSP
jgi:hypothetical protein